MENTTEKATTAINDWLKQNIITLLILLTTLVAGYVRLESRLDALDRRGQERTLLREAQITELKLQLEGVKAGYVTRTELNGTVVSRLDRIEEKLDRAIESR